MKRATYLSLSIAAACLLGACAGPNSPQPNARSAREPGKAMFAAADADRAAQPAAAKAQQLPVGHPPVATAADVQPAPAQPQAEQQLPSGHPDISELMKQRQAQQNQATAQAQPSEQNKQPQQLPPGHPPLPAQEGAAMPAQTDQSSPHPQASEKPALFGTLTIQARQGTPDGPAVGEMPAVVELYHNGQVMSKLDTKLDASGKAIIPELPLTVPFQPSVKAVYDGVEYQAIGHVMDSTHPNQDLHLAVYQGAEQAPQWNVRMQHVMMQATPDGLQVMEMLAIQNPDDRAWIGQTDSTGARRTFVLPLPAGAQNVQMLEGFDECCTKVENGQIINPKPLVPGTTQYQYAYMLPITNGQAQFTVQAAAPVKHLMVFVPDDGSGVVATGLEDMGVSEMKNGKTRFYKAADLGTGAQVQLALSGLKATAIAQPSAAANSSAQAAQVIAIGGGLLIFVIGGFFLFVRAPKAKTDQA